MFTRLSNGWGLAKASWHVLKLDKEMLVFPLASGLACILVLASFAVPLVGSEYAQTIMDEESIPKDPLAWAILFAFYFVNYFVIEGWRASWLQRVRCGWSRPPRRSDSSRNRRRTG